ncbi:MAG TPA: Rieske 2Fe-2S domain-containing protein [Gemmatimonadaceae bacterium]|nr:Rieske 2Fe-2S domain-containing protein [Gemmatimonadaceae bacterium]
MSEFEPVADVDDLPEGGLLGVTTSSGDPVCLLNVGGRISAMHDCCTHAEFLLSDGVIHRDGTVECVWHGARFDCHSGAVKKGPAVDPVPMYDVRVEGGKILVGPRRVASEEAVR